MSFRKVAKLFAVAQEVDIDYYLERIEAYEDLIDNLPGDPYAVYSGTSDSNDSYEFREPKRDHAIERIYERGGNVHSSAVTQKFIDEVLTKANGRDSILTGAIEPGKALHAICPDGNIAIFRKVGFHLVNVTVLAEHMGIPRGAQTSVEEEFRYQKQALAKKKQQLLEAKKRQEAMRLRKR